MDRFLPPMLRKNKNKKVDQQGESSTIKKWTMTEGDASLNWSVNLEKISEMENSIILFTRMIEAINKEIEKYNKNKQ